jgi:hypothetical protein
MRCVTFKAVLEVMNSWVTYLLYIETGKSDVPNLAVVVVGGQSRVDEQIRYQNPQHF